VGGQLHVLAALPPGKDPKCSLNKRMYGPKIQAEIQTQNVSPYASHLTDYNVPSPLGFCSKNKLVGGNANVGDLCGLGGFCHRHYCLSLRNCEVK
jgi:hypothetical protein